MTADSEADSEPARVSLSLSTSALLRPMLIGIVGGTNNRYQPCDRTSLTLTVAACRALLASGSKVACWEPLASGLDPISESLRSLAIGISADAHRHRGR